MLCKSCGAAAEVEVAAHKATCRQDLRVTSALQRWVSWLCAGGNCTASVERIVSEQHVWLMQRLCGHFTFHCFFVGLFLWGGGVHIKQIPSRLQLY